MNSNLQIAAINCYQLLGVTPPVSIAELKLAYRKAAAIHHPDRGGNHEAMIAVNDAYEQIKWEVELASIRARYESLQPQPQPQSQPPRSDSHISDWHRDIDRLIDLQQQKGYKKGWITYRLMDSKIKPPLGAWEYLAQRLDYRSRWARYKYEEWGSAVG